MLLLIDVGNTRIKWAAAEKNAAAGNWITHDALLHTDVQQLQTQWSALTVERVLISNVAGSRVAQLLEQYLLASGIAAAAINWFQSRAACAGVINGYREPARLGSDRFASLIAAHHQFPASDLLVVTAGTATTIDALDAEGHFKGGMILPGLATMAQSLTQHAAQLPAVNEVRMEKLFADNTQKAMQSGCISAQIGAIQRAQHALPEALCILSGGAAAYIAPQMQGPFELMNNLVLMGLHIVALSEPAI